MTKIGILFILLITAVVGLNNESEAKMLNKFKEGFYFEKYKTEEEVKEILLKLHPIGSDLKDLADTLEKAGAEKYNPYDYYKKQDSKIKKHKKPKNIDFYKYRHTTLKSIYNKNWNIPVKYNENKKIITINVQIYQGE